MKKEFLYSVSILVITLIILGILEFYGFIWHTELFTNNYEVKGIDISHYQGNINWYEFRENNTYSFVFMKATEGHDYVDVTFFKNWKEAKKQGLYIGAYHFFSMRSSGEKQAQFFISIVPFEENSLPPVIDVEIHTNHDPKIVRAELMTLIQTLKNYYKKNPILYVTYDSYNAYIKEYFLDYNLWFRDIFKPPSSISREWMFWQYSNRGRIKGIENYTDKNVFYGSREQFIKEFGDIK